MKRYNSFSTILFIFTTIILILPELGHTIPAFARRYKISCTTCHSAFPRLKAYGNEFAGNGFIIPEKEAKRAYVSAGDDLLWLNRDFPVAARMEMFATHDQNKEVETDLKAPWGIKLLSGGTLYKNIGYYFYFYLSERGEVAGIEDAYIHFNNIFGSRLDIMVGQFQTSDPLMKRELRLTYEDYMVYKNAVGASNINLAYDRGVMLVYELEQTGTDLIAMVVNGNGKPEAVNRVLDQDNYKNFGFRINQAIGDMLTIGGFAYLGKEQAADSLNINHNNKVSYFGPDISFATSSIELTAQYLYRKDSNPSFMASAKEIETTGGIVELVFAPDIDRSRYYLTALYNWIDSDLYQYQTATLSYTYVLARNLRLMGEYTRDMENNSNRFVAGVVAAF